MPRCSLEQEEVLDLSSLGFSQFSRLEGSRHSLGTNPRASTTHLQTVLLLWIYC